MSASVNVLSMTLRAGAALTADTAVKFDGTYGTAPILGIVQADTPLGELAPVGVKGVFQLKLAPSQTLAPGDSIAVNSAGLGVTTSGAGIGKVFSATTSSALVII